VEDIVVPSVLDHEGVKLGDIIDIRSSMLYVIALIHKDFFFFFTWSRIVHAQTFSAMNFWWFIWTSNLLLVSSYIFVIEELKM
jgi:hypothetical protein